MEKKKEEKSNIKIEYDEMGRKIWKVLGPEENKNPAPPPAPEEKDKGNLEWGKKRVHKRDTLKKREYKLNLEKKEGKEYKLTKDMSVDQVSPFYWSKCEITMKDSQSYVDHLNGKKHNRNLGMSMYVEKKNVGSVKRKLKELKKLAELKKQKKLQAKKGK